MASHFIFVGYYIEVPHEDGFYNSDNYKRLLAERKYRQLEWYDLFPGCNDDRFLLRLIFRNFDHHWEDTGDLSVLTEKHLEKPNGTYEIFAQIKRTDFYREIVLIWQNAKVCWGVHRQWM